MFFPLILSDKCNVTTQNARRSETQVSVVKAGERFRTTESPYVMRGGRTKCGEGLCRAIHQCSVLGIGTHVTDLTSQNRIIFSLS